ncbi:MAG: ABC transporter substrate-binding protein [Alphaproteobacteria bacterium]
MSKHFLRSGLVAAACAATLAVGGTAAHAQDTIKIGSFLAVSGPAAFLGDPEKKTLELYVDKINEEGGVLGKQIELVLYDSGMDAAKAVTLVKRLIDQDEVEAIIGGTTTGETMAVVGEVEQAEIPFISLGGASVIVDPVKKWVFKTPHTDRVAVGKAFADMQKEGITKVGLIGGAGGFDKSCLANADALAPEYGLEVVATETYGSGDTDMTPQLTKLRNAEGIQGVMFCGFGAASTIVTKNYRQLGIDVPFYHNHGSCSLRFVQGSEGAAEGVRLPCAALLVADQLPDDDPQKEVGLAYAAAYSGAYGEEISTFGGHAYDALFLLVGAIERAGSTDKAAVRDALEATENFVGVDGIFTMGADNHVGLDLDSFKMLEVRDNDWSYLY